MPELSLKQIKTLLQTRKPLPKAYSVKSDNVNFDDILDTLAAFNDNKAMMTCIEKIGLSSSLVKLNNVTYSMNSIVDFQYVYCLSEFETGKLNAESITAINGLFKNVSFGRLKLLELIKKLSYVQLSNYILSTKCFSDRILLEIVNKEENLLSFKPEMITCLYFYFNPQRKWEASRTPLLDMHYFANRAGHTLGLSDAVSFEYNQTKYSFNTEGQLESVSLKLLSQHLELYHQKYPSAVFASIAEAFKFSENLIRPIGNPYQKGSATKFLERYKQKQMAYFSSQWWHHGFGIALYGDYLVYANRGEAGDPRFGCKIYKIKDVNLITKEFIKKLTNATLDKPRTFYKLINPIIDVKNPVIKFSSRQQKHGTCTFANPKSIIEAMIVLFNTGSNCSPQELRVWYFRHYRRSTYKHFTSFIRDAEIDELVKNMFYAKSACLQHFFAALVKKIISSHHGQKDRGWIKDKEEIRRALDLYNRLPAHIKMIVDNDTDFQKLINTTIKAHEKLFPFVKEPAITNYVKPISFRRQNHKVTINGKGNIIRVNDKDTPEMHFSYRMAKNLILANT